LAGRSPEKLEAVASRLGLPSVAIDLSSDPKRLREMLSEHALVFHAAGPFAFTADPMVRACLDARAHYLDLSGEIDSLEHVWSFDAAARERGVTLLPAAGFDVIASDCVARYVAARVSEPLSLDIALAAIGQPSAGTLKSALEIISGGGRVRRNGTLVFSPLGREVERVRFPGREMIALAFPGPDLVTAFRTTGAPDITVYMAIGRSAAWALRLAGPMAQRLLASAHFRTALGRIAELRKPGPDEAARVNGRSFLWASARGTRGDSAQAWLETMEGYRFTAVAGVRVVEHLLKRREANALAGGATTPALLLGANFVLELPETRRLDALPPEYA
jgi:short subunit dehydrogenase-like uncharacterized protein